MVVLKEGQRLYSSLWGDPVPLTGCKDPATNWPNYFLSVQVDSYSAFYDNGGFRQTELDRVLKQHDIALVVVTGLALDYCVYFTSMDAFRLGGYNSLRVCPLDCTC